MPTEPVNESVTEFEDAWTAAQAEADKLEAANPDLKRYADAEKEMLGKKSAKAKTAKAVETPAKAETPPRGADGKFAKTEAAAAPESAAEEESTEEPEPVAESAEVSADDDLTDDEKRETLAALAQELGVELAKPLAERTPEEKRAQLEALAKDLNFKVTGERVAIQERADFREDKRQFRDQKTQWEQRANAFVQQTQPLVKLCPEAKDFSALATSLEPLIKARAAYDAGDMETAIQLTTGRTLSEINEDAVAAGSGNWRYMRQIQQERDREKAERAAERAEVERLRGEREQQEQVARTQQYQQRIAAELAQSADKEIAETAKTFGPQLVAAVFTLQQKFWDTDDGTTISAEEAAQQVVGDYRQTYQSLQKIFGATVAPAKVAPESTSNSENGSQPSKQAAEPRNGKPLRRIATQQTRREAGRRAAHLDDKEWLATTAQALKQADDWNTR